MRWRRWQSGNSGNNSSAKPYLKLRRRLMKRLLIIILSLCACVSIANAQYVASKKSNKYHEPNCRWAMRISENNLITFVTAEEATNSGYVPCKTCRPGGSTNNDLPAAKSSSVVQPSSYSSGRCAATTKKGTQCKRKAQAGSMYCWQHQR